jgi:hypothetical protein
MLASADSVRLISARPASGIRGAECPFWPSARIGAIRSGRPADVARQMSRNSYWSVWAVSRIPAGQS